MIQLAGRLVRCVVCWAMLLSSQKMLAVASAQRVALPPIHPLGPGQETLIDPAGRIVVIRPLTDGRVLVQNVRTGQVRLYDSTLVSSTVLIGRGTTDDSAYARGRIVSNPELTGLVPTIDDTTRFVDQATHALLLITPSGVVTHRAAPSPPVRGESLLVAHGRAVIESKGWLFYRVTDSLSGALRVANKACDDPKCAAAFPPFVLDSQPIARASLSTGEIDTVGYLRTQRNPPSVRMSASGRVLPTSIPWNPLLQHDDWAVLSDGSIAILRAGDVHIDWIAPDGTRRSTPPMVRDWPRLPDSAKAAIVDATTRERQTFEDRPARVGGGTVPQAGFKRIVGPPANALPDYLEPFGLVMADADDHLWIAEPSTGYTTTGCAQDARVGLLCISPNAALIFDIVNRNGQVVDRVQLPPSRVPIGFGPGVVYLTDEVGAGRVLAKYRVK